MSSPGSHPASRWSRRAPRWTPLNAQLAAQYPRENAAVSVNVEPLRSEIVGDIRPLLLVLFGAVCFVLLIACANIANLMMSRSIDRRREFAVRVALGAKQIHLMLQLLIESLLLSVAGAIVRLAMLAQAISRTKHTAPNSTSNSGRM